MLGMSPPPYSTLRPPSTNWASRLSRLPAAAGPYASTIINILPPSTQTAVASVLQSTTTFALYTLVVYLAGVITGGFLPSRHHHHFSPYPLVGGASDRALWTAYNTLSQEGMPMGGGSGGGLAESILFWIERCACGIVSSPC
jgi:hypothetical protein